MSFIVKNLLLTGLFFAFFLFISSKMGGGPGFFKVIGFELSYFSKNGTATAVEEWRNDKLPSGKTKLEFLAESVRWDYLYLIGYVFFGVFLARVAAGENRLGAANTIAILLVIAGLSDVVENLQIQQIVKENYGLRPMVMSICAAVKLLLLLVSIGWAVWLFSTKR
jgi:hypothetical protein